MKIFTPNLNLFTVFAFFILSSSVIKAQTTTIPDDAFENYLETHNASGILVSVGDPTSMGDGIDGNDEVFTSSISNVTGLNISNYNISSFQGLQDFQFLQTFLHINNQTTSNFDIDFSGNTLLTEIDIITAPFLEEINVSQNSLLTRLQVATEGNFFTSIDVSNNSSLTHLNVWGNQLTTINTDNNLSIDFFGIHYNPIESIDVSHLILLGTFITRETQIELLDLSSNINLTSLLAYDGELQTLNLKNNSNALLGYIDVRNNFDLSCIYVDDASIALANTNWNKDPAAIYVDMPVNIDVQAQGEFAQYDNSGNYSTDLNVWIANNGGAIATSDCGEITWSNSYYISDNDGNVVYVFDFFATDVFGNVETTSATFTLENAGHFSEPIYGRGDTICEDSLDLNSVITNIEPGADLYAPEIQGFSISRISNGETNEGPSGESLSNSIVDFPDTGAGSYSYLFRVSLETLVSVYQPDSDDFGFVGVLDDANVTLNDKTVAFEVEELEDISICPGDFSSIQDLTDLLVISPDLIDFPPQESVDLNLYWTPSTYTGPGTYTFNPTAAFPNCPSNSVSITISTGITVIQEPQPLMVVYNPNGNDTEIDAWLNNNGGAQISTCDVAVWSYELDYYEIDSFDFDDSLLCHMIFTATDIFGNEELFPVILEFQSFAVAGETNQGDGVVCGKTYDLSGINGIDFGSNIYENSIVNVSGDGTINGFDVDFPDTGAGSFFYSYSFTVMTNISIGSLNVDVFDGASWSLPNVVIPFNPGEDKQINICEGDVLTLEDLYNTLVVIDGTEDPLFNPDDYWTPSSYQGPGIYTFDAGDFLIDCGGIPTTVTVIANGTTLSLDVSAQDQSSSFYVSSDFPINLDLDAFNNWLNSNGGASAASSCGDVIWSYSYDVNYSDLEDTVTYVTTFVANDGFDSVNTIATYTFDNVYVNAGADFIFESEAGIDGGTRCGNDDFSLGIIQGFYIFYDGTAATYEFVQTDGPSGTVFTNSVVDFPDTGAGQFLYSFDFNRELDVSFPDIDVQLSDEAVVTFWVVVPFDVGEDGTFEVCEGQNVTLDDLYNAIEGTPDLEGSNFDMEDLWTPSVYQGPGEYVFDFSQVAPDCSFDSSVVTVIETNCDTSLSLKIFLEGAYNTNTGLMRDDMRNSGILPTISPYADAISCNASVFNVTESNAIIDWIWIELRDNNDQTLVIESRSALLRADGTVVDVDGISPLAIDVPANDYYLMLSHRNHLGVITLDSYTFDGTALNIDLTTSNLSVQGGNNAIASFSDGAYGLYAGDFNGDGQIQNTDRNGVIPLRGISGYNNADINLNGEVQNNDINGILTPNIGKGEQFMSRNLFAPRRQN